MKHLSVIISSLVLCSILLSQSCAAYEPIELNDATRNLLNLDLSKGIESLQEALKNDFKFKRLEDIKRFLNYCAYVREAIAQSRDDDYRGLAQKIKALLVEPRVELACRMTVPKLDELAQLADGFHVEPLDHLSTKKFNSLVALQEYLRADESAQLVLSHLFRESVEKLSHSLLVDSIRDFAIMVDEKVENKKLFDFETRYKEGCQISLIAPICQLVRRTSQPNVEAIGADLVDFSQLVVNNEQEKIQSYEEASNVSISELKDSCKQLNKQMAFRTLEKIASYAKAGFLNQQQVDEHRRSHKLFDFYTQLFNTCQLLDN